MYSKFNDNWITCKTNSMLNIFDYYRFNPNKILEIGVHEGFSTIFFQYAFDNFESDIVNTFQNNKCSLFERNLKYINHKRINKYI